jgi:hypothetical protein
MSQFRVEVSEVIDAPPQVVYDVISDYRVGHPTILPKPYFTGLAVEEGGQGAGTVVFAHLKVMGVERTYRLVVSEPEPGRVLVEADEDAGVVTRFTVEPLRDGKQSRVTISTVTKASPGIQGVMEKLINPPITRRIYQQELQQLDEYLRSQN